MNVLESVAALFRTEKKTAANQMADLVERVAVGEYVAESDAAEVLKLNGATPAELAAHVQQRKRYRELLDQLKRRPELEQAERTAEKAIAESKARLDAEAQRHNALVAAEWPKVQFSRKQLAKLVEAKTEIQGVLPEEAKSELADITADQFRIVGEIRRLEERIRYDAPRMLGDAQQNLKTCEANAAKSQPSGIGDNALADAQHKVRSIQQAIESDQQALAELRQKHADNSRRINVLTHSDL